MSREIVINAERHESRIAVLDEGQVVELWVERTRHRTIVGNIYKGRVTKVLPGMQSAFVDLGLERDAFLYVSDVIEDLEEFDNADSTDDLSLDDVPQSRAEASIADLLREGQEIVVQVSKDTIAGKGARITSHITLPGRFLVYMPTVNHIGVSRRFEDVSIEGEIAKALKSKVWLKSGGYIVINQTEALVAIDVNTRKYVGKKNLEETVFKTNLEAAKEIVRQIRLRDLGGIIVLDFIDMEDLSNRAKLFEALEIEIRKDR